MGDRRTLNVSVASVASGAAGCRGRELPLLHRHTGVMEVGIRISIQERGGNKEIMGQSESHDSERMVGPVYFHT